MVFSDFLPAAILGGIVLGLIIAAHVKRTEKKEKALKAEMGEFDEDSSINQGAVLLKSYTIEDPELAHGFSVRANNFWGFSHIIHSIFVLAFLFFPVDLKGIDSLFECFSDIISDPLDELFNPISGLAVAIATWGIYYLLLGVATLIQSRNPNFIFSHFDYTSFLESCHESFGSRLFGSVAWSLLSGGFWALSIFMLNISFEDVLMAYIAICVYILVFSIIEQEIRRSIYLRGINEYELVECANDPSASATRPASRSIAFILFTLFVIYLFMAKFAF